MSIRNEANQMEQRISDIKHRNLEMMQREEETNLSIKKYIYRRALQELSDSFQKSNIRIIETPEEDREREQRSYSNSQ